MTNFEAVSIALEVPDEPKLIVDNKICGFFKEYRFLSNYHMHPVEFEGIVYPSTEHAYQAAKSIIPREREFIASLKAPGSARKQGRQLTLRSDFDHVKDLIMTIVCQEKFRDPELRQKLLDTLPYNLVEGNWWGDTYWGVDSKKGGKNTLGEILMSIREHI